MSVEAYLPPDALDREEAFLAPYAMRTRQSRGRRHVEDAHPYRTLYQRDRDRIVHSKAFRRLLYKTQVLVNHTSDQHRTRLTHTLEVAQISRTIAAQLGLNEDLTEAVALLHDLGHPPFGHAGERALNDAMKEHGGFEHNRQGLRLVEQLERRYPNFPGLNLSWEVLESQAFHSKRPEAAEVKPYRSVGQPLLEAQVVDAADSLAYDTHDLDDGLSLGLITLDDVRALTFFPEAAERVLRRHGVMPDEQFQSALVRVLIDWQVNDLLETTRKRIRELGITGVESVRAAPQLAVMVGAPIREMKSQLEMFLWERVYQHHRVERMARKAHRFLSRLFDEYRRHPKQLPAHFYQRIANAGLEQTICDYLSGMTDRYAQDEYLRLFHPYESV